jgi:hypothetical protein
MINVNLYAEAVTLSASIPSYKCMLSSAWVSHRVLHEESCSVWIHDLLHDEMCDWYVIW